MTADRKYALTCGDGCAMWNDPVTRWWTVSHGDGCTDPGWRITLGNDWASRALPEPWTGQDQADLLALIATGTLKTPRAQRVRTCSKCSRSLPLKAYGRDRLGRDGLKARCRQCCRASGDSEALRSRRSRAHRRGDHGLCNPARCAEAEPASAIASAGAARATAGHMPVPYARMALPAGSSCAALPAGVARQAEPGARPSAVRPSGDWPSGERPSGASARPAGEQAGAGPPPARWPGQTHADP
jgi:hypothetical protein